MIRFLLVVLLAVSGGGRERADALFAEGKWEEARSEYQALLDEAESPAEKAELSDRIGLTILREGGVWEAEKWFTRSIQAAESALARLHRAPVYVRAGQRSAREPGVLGAEVRSLMNDAARDLARSLELDPRSAEALFTLGMCERYRDDLAAELAAFRKALEVEPGHLDASLQLAWRLEGRTEVDAAREVLLEVAEARRDVRHWMALGRLAGKAGDAGAEKEAWTRAILSSPEAVTAYDGLWQATAVKKRFADFEKAMARVLESSPDAWLAHYFLGFCHRYAKRPKEAIAAFRRTLEIRPEEIQARVKIADILSAELRDPDAAADEYLKALAADPENERSRLELARLALNKAAEGKFADAHRLYTALCEADPNEASHPANLALLEKELGRAERGLELYLEAEERFPFNARLP
ncbi:MAG: tetratricopeptide repeat protein, partial [Planctomycetota bacterium]